MENISILFDTKLLLEAKTFIDISSADKAEQNGTFLNSSVIIRWSFANSIWDSSDENTSLNRRFSWVALVNVSRGQNAVSLSCVAKLIVYYFHVMLKNLLKFRWQRTMQAVTACRSVSSTCLITYSCGLTLKYFQNIHINVLKSGCDL